VTTGRAQGPGGSGLSAGPEWADVESVGPGRADVESAGAEWTDVESAGAGSTGGQPVTAGPGVKARTADTVIRSWCPADLEPTLAIFNQAVAQTTATWHWSPKTPDQWADYCQARLVAPYSFLVATRAGAVVGYAAVGPFRDRDGYKATAENAVYVAPDSHGQGVGGQLLAALIERSRSQGLHVLVAALDSTNEISAALHAKFGFHEVGRLRQIGQKFGRWLDLALWQLTLDDRPTPPSA